MGTILIRVKVLARPRTAQPNGTTLVEEDEGNRYEQNGNEAQQTGCPLIVELLVHLRGEQGESSTDEVPDEDDTGQRGGRVGLVTVDDVVEDTEDDDVETRTEERRRNDGDNPVHGPVAGPAEPEQTNRDEQGADTGHPHTCLGHTAAAVLGYATQVVPLLQRGQGAGDDGSNGHTQEAETLLADVEAVAVGFAKNEGEGFVEEVDQAVKEAVVDGGEGGDGLGEQEAEGTSEGDSEQLVQALAVFCVEVGGGPSGAQPLALHLLAHAGCLTLQDDTVTGFRDSEDQRNPGATGDGHHDPEDPVPVQVQANVAADHQGHGRAKRATKTVEGHGATTMVTLPQITDGTTRVGQRGTTCETGNETADNNGANVGCQCQRHLEKGHDEPRDDINGLATEVLG